MSWSMILRRMRRDGRVFAILLLAMTLVTAFFALSPFYIRSVAEAALRYTVEHAYPGTFNLTLRNAERTDLAYQSILNEELGGLARSVEQVTYSGGVFCDPPGRVCTGNEFRAYLPIGFSQLETRFTLTAGRWPQATENATVVEAVITPTVSNRARYAVGDSFVLNGTQTPTITVQIVGLVDPVDAENPFWDALTFVTVGQITDVTPDLQRFDFGVIIPEGEYDRTIAPVVRSGSVYDWVIEIEPHALRAGSLEALAASLNRTEARFRQLYPEVTLSGGLFGLIADFQLKIAAAERPVILLSGAVLLLMVYQLMTTTALILEGQQVEWAAITSRGGSIRQLVQLQLGTLALLGLVAVIAALPLARAILALLERVGPLAAILEGAPSRVEGIPPTSIWLSLIAALLMLVALTLPAIPAARKGILALKGSISRPPTRPTWARYFLDWLLLIIGFAFLVRLYFLVGGDASRGLSGLLQDPGAFIRLIAASGDTALLGDPFNLAGTALILTGAALLWLRIFPFLMHVLSALARRLTGLLIPLAFWSIERDPNHYAQMVLLLIGTLALGTASLALSATHDVGAWESARRDTGGYAQIQAMDMDTLALPEVTSGVALMKYTTVEMEGEPRTTVLGVDPAALAIYEPATAPITAPLGEQAAFPLSGLALSAEARTLSMQVYAAPLAGINTRLALVVENRIGVQLSIPLTTADEARTGEFVNYTAELPADQTYAPWRLVGLRFQSQIANETNFQHTVYIDTVTVTDAAGTATVLEDFERLAVPEWTATNQGRQGFFVTATSAQAAGGDYSLRVDYVLAQRGAQVFEPLLEVQRAPGGDPALPIIVSQAYADHVGRRSERRRALEVGATGTATLRLAQGEMEFRYQVVGVVASFPTLQPDQRYFIARSDHLQLLLNRIATPDSFYALNEAWLTFPTRAPSAAFLEAVQGHPVLYANDRYNALRREPLPNAITGMLFTGFWVSLGLGLLDFGFYLAMTARRRATSFAVLRALGWNSNKLWRLLTVEQAALITPALVIGVLLGGLLAYLLLPFLALLGGETLQFPLLEITYLLIALVVAFALLLGITAAYLQRMSINQVLREE
ncbi:MAG: FtsX-like permease family protein [Anaerolineae bacterium]|nr:FtsX-like permease family protein [Anaerolineae bacterium]